MVLAYHIIKETLVISSMFLLMDKNEANDYVHIVNDCQQLQLYVVSSAILNCLINGGL